MKDSQVSMNKKYLVFDISNLLYRNFYANKSQDDLTAAGIAHHMALVTLNKFYKMFKPDQIILTFDRSSWRKIYTASEECISKKKYKGNRRQNMTPAEKKKFELFVEHLKDFEEIVRVHTSMVCLAGDLLEADDLMAGFVQSHQDAKEIVIVTADKDMLQLLRHDNVTLLNPMNGKPRDLKEWDGDADLFMFEKCLRGDLGDNVGSAYPRIRKTKIWKAYSDPMERANIMHDTWRDQEGREMVVKHVFKENELLMDLTAQPETVRRKMDEVIEHEMENPGKFSYFKFLGFCGKYELKKISEGIEQYIPMLSR